MASTASKKLLDEAYVYAKLASAAYTNHGDIAYFRVTGATAAEYTAGTETSPSSGTVFVIALSKVKAATKVMLNDTDYVTFAAGNPKGTCLKGTLTKAIDNGGITAFVNGTPGEQFVVMKDPGLTSADPLLLYVQSKSETGVGGEEKPVYDRNIFKGIKKLPVNEPNTLSMGQHFQAHDKGLLGFRGHRFNLLVERDDNREGTITEQEYYFGCFFANAGPNESTGDNESDVSFDVQYLYKGVVAG